ncbi:MAG: hypothetical protein ACRCYS_11515 [Beijerinckiaceae bacterium]
MEKKNKNIGLDKAESKELFGRKLYRVVALAAIAHLGICEGDKGGWCSEQATIGERLKWIAKESTIWGGTIEGGTIEGGTIWGGTIKGGTIKGGTIWGGTIEGGTIKGGTIEGGTIWGGTIKGGTIEGGTIKGGTITQQPLSISRSDGFFFTLNMIDGQPMVGAGCRFFTFEQSRIHWQKTRGGTPLGDETFVILEHLELIAKATGQWSEAK